MFYVCVWGVDCENFLISGLERVVERGSKVFGLRVRLGVDGYVDMWVGVFFNFYYCG